MIYAIDIDGTLTIETEGWDYENRTPKPSHIAGVNRLFDAGHSILLFTARFEEDRGKTTDWLRKYGVKYTRLIMDKPQYDVVIDDKMLPPSMLEHVGLPSTPIDDSDKCPECGSKLYQLMGEGVNCPACGYWFCF
jgi:hypothetical protein